MDLNAGGNVTAGNVTANNTVFASYANISNDLSVLGNANITGNLTSGNAYLNNTQITGNANISNNMIANGIAYANNFMVVGSTSSEGGQLVLGYAGINGITGQDNGTWNVDVDASNNFRIFNQYANAAVEIPVTIYNGNSDVSFSANIAVNGNNITLGNTAINWATVTTTAITANQTIAAIPVSGVTGVEFFVKGVDSSGAKFSTSTVMAVTNGVNVDYVIYGTTFLGATTGTLAVNIVGANIALQVSPASTNSTVWTTQFRTI